MSDQNPTQRFTGLAQLYSAVRPNYPKEAIDFVISHCNLLPTSLLVDVGSGTGISARIFADCGMKVIGIEPNQDMRQQAELENIEFKNQNKPHYISGTAENTGLPDKNADAVIAAQAFHWFEPNACLKEFHRILKVDGWVILMWNERDESDPFTRDYGDAIRTFSEAKSIESKRRISGDALFKTSLFADCAKNEFENQQVLDQNGLIGRAFSSSYAPKEKSAANPLEDRLKKIFDKYQQNNLVKLRYITSVYTARALK